MDTSGATDGTSDESSDAIRIAGDDRAGAGEALLGTLIEAAVVRGDDELTLDPAFREAWRDRMAELRDTDLAGAIEAAHPGVVAESTDHLDTDYYAVTDPDGGVESDRMVSHVVAVADVAAIRTLSEREIPPDAARRAARPLRQFLVACPGCDSDLTTMHESCCGGHGPRGPTAVLACPACSVPVFVFDDDAPAE